MAIKKIQTIKNIGSFREFEWDVFNKYIKLKSVDIEITEFWKKNVLYGDNGNGKSTLVKVLKSLNKNTNALPTNWDTPTDIQEIKIEMNDGSENFFSSTWWSVEFQGKFHIFDREFIRNSVWDLHDEIETEISKKRGEHFFTLGAFKQKEQLLAELKNEKNEINKLLPTGKEILNMFSTLEIIKEETIRWEKKIELDKKLEIQTKKRSDTFKRKENLIAIQKQKIPEWLSLDSKQFFEDCKVFSQKLSSLIFSYWEETAIKEIITLIHRHSETECLVCKQEIKTHDGAYIPRIQELIDTILESSIEEAEKQMNKDLLDIKGFLELIQGFWEALEAKKTANLEVIEALRGFWVDVSEYSDISWLTFSLGTEEISIIDALLKLVWEKGKSKSTVINFDGKLIQPILNRILDILSSLNKALELNNLLLKKVQEQNVYSVQSELDSIDVEIGKTNLWLSLIQNYLRIEAFISRCRDFFNEEKSEIDGEWELKTCLDKLRIIINGSFNLFVKKYGETIRKNVEYLNSSIAVKLDCVLDGWISHGASRCGFKLTYNGNDIARDLSDGEKRVVALAYFFALRWEEVDQCAGLQNKTDIMQESLSNPLLSTIEKENIRTEQQELQRQIMDVKNKILVFDDPVTDFDAGHKQTVAIKIDEIGNFYEQTYVFTHDEKFKEYIGKCWEHQTFFSIQKVFSGSIITPLWKPQIDLYQDDLREFYTSWSGGEYFRIRENVYKLRYCLEDWIKREWLFWWEERFDRILSSLLKIPKWEDKNVAILKEIHKFCNLNGSHEWTCEGLNALKKNIEHYFEIRWIPLLLIQEVEVSQ